MATKVVTHTFNGGMNKDFDKSIIPNNSFYHAENFRLVADKEGKKTILKNNKGMSNTYIKFPVTGIPVTEYIVGYCLVRNYLVVFTYDGSSVSSIYKVELDDNEELVSVSTVFADYDTEDGSTLGFSLSNRVKAVGRYENDDLINVYWCDGSELSRRINIATNNTTDGLPYSGSNDYVSVHKLDFIDKAYLRKPVINKITGGSLITGVVYYAYQFFNLNGNESLYSPLSDKISVSTSSYAFVDASKFRGGDSGEYSGKGFRLRIENDDSYDYVRLIRIHYEEYNGIPTISIVKEVEVTTGTYLYITDNGVTVSEISLEDFVTYSNILFSAKEITTKNDYLLFGNIEEDTFEVDFDVRSYRFNSSGVAKLYQSDGSYYYVYAAGVTRTGQGGPATLGDWEYFTSGSVYTGTHGTGWTVPEDADCINYFNNISVEGYYYQNDASTVGGSGLNVEYEFLYGYGSNVITIESDASVTKGDIRTGGTYSAGDSGAESLVLSQDGVNSYTTYANPFNEDIVGYQPDEVYRFAVVCGDAKGREATAKWIGDIRMPRLEHYASGSRIYRSGTDIVANILNIKFTISNLPSDVEYFRIVRAERTNVDKSVVACGALSHTYYDSGLSMYVSPIEAKLSGAAGYYGGDNPDNDLFSFMSPEINYGQYQYTQGDMLYVLYVMDDYCSYYSTDKSFIKYNSYVKPGTSNRPVYDIDDLKILSPNPPTEDTEYSIGVFTPYVHMCTDKGADSPFSTDKGPCGTAAILDLTSNVTGPDIYYAADLTNDHSIYYACIKRNVDTSRYGGITYTDRFFNEYYPCSNRYDSSYDGVQITVYGGDCYINMFDHLRCTYHINESSGDRRIHVMYFPVESQINLAYDHGDSYHRIKGKVDATWVRETAGEHDTASGTFVQDNDYYLYNTVYSIEPKVESRISETSLDFDLTKFDTRVLVSDKKYNNEISDSWTKFRANNFLDVDSNYGELTNLFNFKDKVFYFQPNGFGVLSVNERSLISDNNTNQLVLGTGGVLDRYDYISNTSGSSSRFGVVKSKRGIYWIDEKRKEVYFFNGNENKISKLKGVDSYLKGLTSIDSVEGTFDNTYDDVLFSITNDGSKENTLVYNELDGVFCPFFTYQPFMFITLDKNVLSIEEQNSSGVYKHNVSDTRCSYYNNGVSDSKVTFICNENYPFIKVWDNIEYFSEVNYINDTTGVRKNLFDTTFTYANFYNDYQNTDTWEMKSNISMNNNVLKELALKRRERNWTFGIPRNAVDKDVSNDPDIFDSSNLDTTQTFRERMRSSFLYCSFIYENNSSTGYEFSIPYMNIKYRISNR